jgi:DNA repair exonuclease SbcCD ATPase subunit
LVIAHSHNSFDKKKLLDDPSKYLMTETPYSLTDFITNNSFPYISFYKKDLHLLLDDYLPGSILFKPQIHSYITEVEKIRIDKENKINTYKSATSVMPQTTIKEYEDKLQHKSILIQKLIKELKETREELKLIDTRHELNLKVTLEELEKTREELEKTREELKETKNELKKTQEILKETQGDLDAMSWKE